MCHQEAIGCLPASTRRAELECTMLTSPSAFTSFPARSDTHSLTVSHTQSQQELSHLPAVPFPLPQLFVIIKKKKYWRSCVVTDNHPELLLWMLAWITVCLSEGPQSSQLWERSTCSECHRKSCKSSTWTEPSLVSLRCLALLCPQWSTATKVWPFQCIQSYFHAAYHSPAYSCCLNIKSAPSNFDSF